MLRALLAIVAVVLLSGLAPVGQAVVSSAQAVAAVTDDCCPDEMSDADCCDSDLGACCAANVMATPPPAALAAAAPVDVPALPSTLGSVPPRWRPRDTGPPPLPPPIG